MPVNVVNLASLELEAERHGVRFEVHRSALGERLGAQRLSLQTAVVPPGKADGPYRFHVVVEQMAMVLGGNPRIRLAGAEYALAPGDFVGLPPRGSSAWQIVNRADGPAHLFLAATRSDRDVVGLPDSGKRIYRVGGPGAGDPEARDIVLKGDRVVDLLDEEAVDVPLGPSRAVGEMRDRRIANVEDVEWEAFGRPPFGGRRRRLSRRVGAERLGYSLYRVEPGRQAFPFHFHHVNEEFFYVRRGYGQLRTLDGTRDLAPGDALLCPPGVGGAHAVLDTGDASLEYFALSTMIEPEVVEYPDSDEAHVMVGAAPGGDPRRRILDRIFRRREASPGDSEPDA